MRRKKDTIMINESKWPRHTYFTVGKMLIKASFSASDEPLSDVCVSEILDYIAASIRTIVLLFFQPQGLLLLLDVSTPTDLH